MRATLGLGLLLTGAIAGLSWRIWGVPSAWAAGIFGLLALTIQLVSLHMMGSVRQAPFARFIARWGAGMGLRLLGVLAIAIAAGLDREHFPPLPTAAGFLGVLLPLLFYEVRLLR